MVGQARRYQSISLEYRIACYYQVQLFWGFLPFDLKTALEISVSIRLDFKWIGTFPEIGFSEVSITSRSEDLLFSSWKETPEISVPFVCFGPTFIQRTRARILPVRFVSLNSGQRRELHHQTMTPQVTSHLVTSIENLQCCGWILCC